MSGKNKRPRRVIQRPGQSFFDKVNAASNAAGVNGQKVSIGSERLGDLYDLLKGLDPIGGGSSFGFGQTKGKTGEGGLAGVTYDQPRGMFAGDSSYADLIKGMYGNSDLTALLKTLGIDWDHEMTASQTNDWNKQILDIILQQYANQEQRAYDRSVLSEQRTYDNPLNQLSRLMGAGISRDAALQMLSGSGSGSGAGSALIGSMGGQVSTGIPASQSELNGIQGKTAIANTVFSGFNALAGLINLGFSAPQAIQQTAFLKAQNYLTQSQISAYQSTGRAFSILNAAGSAAESFGSVSSAAAAITKLAKDGNSDAASFITSGGLQSMLENAPFASHTLADLYHSERASSDYARSYEVAMRRELADAALSEVQVDQVAIEISKAAVEIDNILSSTEYNEALTATCEALGIQYNAQTELINQQTFAQELENKSVESLLGSSYEGKSYLDWRNIEVLNGIVTNAKINSKTVSAEYSEAMYKQMFNSAESISAALALSGLKSEAGLEFATKYPQSFKLWQGLEECGYYEYLDSQVNNNTAGKVTLPWGISFQTRGYLHSTDPNQLYKLDTRTPSNTRGHYK